MKRITEKEMLVTLATMALLDDGFTAHDVIEVLSALGYRGIVVEARENVKASKRGKSKRAREQESKRAKK